MEKLIKKVLIVILMLAAVFAVTACEDPPEELPKYLVSYYATSGGTITGEWQQTVEHGKDASEVTAVPDIGWVFVRWSDGVTTATRQDKRIRADIWVSAEFNSIYFSVTYSAGPNGRLEGETSQSIFFGHGAHPVKAIAEPGYMFAGWSDGVTNAERIDTDIFADINVTAIFEKLSKTFAYIYNNATGNNEEENVKIMYEAFEDTALTVPEKERFVFDGWYLDVYFRTQVTDESGNLLVGEELFDWGETCLYAKWTPVEKINYKILMVFVDEIHATLETIDRGSVDVNYKMSAIERQICHLIPYQVSKYLNEWFDGAVNFEVDTYFTTQPLGSESFSSGVNAKKLTYFIFGNKIPEISGIVDNYRSVITTFSMNDYDNLLHNVGGLATIKYGANHLESFLSSLFINNIPLESVLDLTIPYWESVAESYLHEFTHTVEQGLDVYEYHAVLGYYNGKRVSGLEATRLYLLNKADIDGEIVGITFSFWRKETD